MRELIREFCSQCAVLIAQVNLAVIEGKALELLKERVVGRYGIGEMNVRESLWERSSPDISVTFRRQEHLSPLEESLIRLSIEHVNRRFGTRIVWNSERGACEYDDDKGNDMVIHKAKET